MAATAPVITGWSAVSPFGHGRTAFAAGVRSGRPTAAAVDTDRWSVPDTQACLVPDFDVEELVGGKGLRHLDRASTLALAAVGDLVEQGVDTGHRAGVVLGTTSGSMQTEMTHMRDSLLNSRPHLLNPKTLASGSMNCAAAQCAIRYDITGPNTTLAAGRGATVHALRYSSRLLAADRADSVIVGAVEEYSAARHWLARHSRGSEPLLGEGGAVFRLEPGTTGRAALAEVLGVETRVCLDGAAHPALIECVRALLKRGSVATQEVWAVVTTTTSGAEREAMAELFAPDVLTRVPGPHQIGDTGAASSAFAIASVLSVAERLPEAAGRPVVIVSGDPTGAVAAVLLRLAGEL
ncbi:beta-ketoacyl synthase N-terminal-like domain-containing protein [Lentzea sp. NPDC051213]|uniref:beta-ketoacyl synthase N-terminal-like domain-containing protein n=1 Tax=Lentzea sp. NPDC051213 TaxID=3364126 RepID=UPI0037A63588